jgi:hypothetical protein
MKKSGVGGGLTRYTPTIERTRQAQGPRLTSLLAVRPQGPFSERVYFRGKLQGREGWRGLVLGLWINRFESVQRTEQDQTARPRLSFSAV